MSPRGRCGRQIQNELMPASPVALVRGSRAYVPTSISCVRVSPCAYSQGLFVASTLIINSGKRWSVSKQHSMKIDEQWECWTYDMRDNNEGTYRGGERGDNRDHGLSRRSLSVKFMVESKSDEKTSNNCCCLHIESSFLPRFISTPSVRPDSLS